MIKNNEIGIIFIYFKFIFIKYKLFKLKNYILLMRQIFSMKGHLLIKCSIKLF